VCCSRVNRGHVVAIIRAQVYISPDDRENKGDDSERGESLYMPGRARARRSRWLIFFLFFFFFFLFWGADDGRETIYRRDTIRRVQVPVYDDIERARVFSRNHNERTRFSFCFSKLRYTRAIRLARRCPGTRTLYVYEKHVFSVM